MELKRYDLIFSLGAACSCSIHLRRHGLQKYSYPFDWIYGSDFLGRVKILSNHFKGFIEYEHLECRQVLQEIKTQAYENTANNLVFNHDFPVDLDLKESYHSVREKYDRRINRLFLQLKKSRSTLCVYLENPIENNKNIYDISILKQGIHTINKAYNKDNINLIYITYSEKIEHGNYTINKDEKVTHIIMNYKLKKEDALAHQPDPNVLNKILSFIILR